MGGVTLDETCPLQCTIHRVLQIVLLLLLLLESLVLGEAYVCFMTYG